MGIVMSPRPLSSTHSDRPSAPPRTELGTILESAIDAIVTADEDGKIRSWNPAAERMFGYRWEEVEDAPLEMIIPFRYRAQHREGMRRAAQGNRRLSGKVVEMTALRRDGVEFEIELALSDWQSPSGLRYTGIIRDISARKKAEREAQAYAEDLARHHHELCLARDRLAAAEARTNVARLLAGILHEINSPLGATRSAADTLMRIEETKPVRDNPKALATMAQVITEGVDRISQVVRRLDAIMKLSEAKGGFADVEQSINSALSLLPDLDREVILPGDLAEQPVRVRGSQAQLTHVILSLIRNAAEATPSGGRIELHLHRRDAKIHFRLVDNGRGMSSQDLLEACQYGFTQHDGRVRMRTGLATVKSVVEGLGGEMIITSKLGQGTEVRFHLDEA